MKALAALLLAVGALSACTSPGEPVAAPDGGTPQCSVIWQPGEILPGDYQGCLQGDRPWPLVLNQDGGTTFGHLTASKLGQPIIEVCDGLPSRVGGDTPKSDCLLRNVNYMIESIR